MRSSSRQGWQSAARGSRRRRTVKSLAVNSAAIQSQSRLERSLEAIKPVLEDLESRQMLAAGLAASFYNNRWVRGETPAGTRVDANVNFNFGNGNPGFGLGNDRYSAIWEGTFTAPEDGTYSFYSRSDDGMRIWANGILVNDHWVDRGAPAVPGDIPAIGVPLTSGQTIPLVIHYYESGSGALAEVRMSDSNTITTARMFNAGEVNTPTTAPAAPTGLALATNPGGGYNANLTFVDGSNDEARFKVQSSTDGGTTWTTQLTTFPNLSANPTGDTIGILAPNLLPNTAYKLRVVASNAAGDTPSNVLDFNTGPAGNGLIGEYFEDVGTNATGNFRGNGTRVFWRRDDGTATDGGTHAGAVDFNWGNGGPNRGDAFGGSQGLPIDDFSARWQGKITITEAGVYRFYSNSDDGSEVYVNGQLVANDRGLHGRQDGTAIPITLSPGTYPIVGYFAERGGGAANTIKWNTPSGGDPTVAANRVPIPASALTASVDPVTAATLTGTAGPISITLNWTDNSLNEHENLVQRSTDGGTTWTTLARLLAISNTNGQPADASFTATGLTPNTAYQFRIVSSNFSDTKNSNVLSISTTALNPGNLTVTPSNTAGDTNLTTEGNADWIEWGYPSNRNAFNQSAAATGPRISNFTVLGTGTTIAYDIPNGKTFSWTNAAPGDVTRPADPVVRVDGVDDGDGAAGDPPAAENIDKVFDNTTSKYLNFRDLGSGVIVTPAFGASVVNGVKLYTANDAVERDPASYVLEGSNDGGTTWTIIDQQNALALPDGRNPGGQALASAAFFKQFDFVNTTSYTSYRITFPTLKNAGGANSMQIGEVELLHNEPAVSATNDAVALSGSGNGFRFTVPAQNQAFRRLNVYVGVEDGVTGQLTATLSDGSIAPVVQTLTSNPGDGFKTQVYTIEYKSSLANQTLTVDWVNQSAAGNIVLAAATWIDFQGPIAPSNLTATATGKGRVALSWTDESGNETGFRIERAPDVGGSPGTFAAIGTVGTNAISFVDSTAADNTKYWYRVISNNAVGDSPTASNVVSATTINVLAAGLKGTYRNLTLPATPGGNSWGYPVDTNDPVLVRLDNGTQSGNDGKGSINFNWGNGSPDPAVNPDNFTVVWEGRLIPDFTEKYTIWTDTDDGIRFYLDMNRNGTFEPNELVVDAFFDQGPGARENSEAVVPGGIPLIAGQDYKIRAEYFERGGGAVALAYWSSTRQGDQIIPVGATLPPLVPPPQGQVQNLTATPTILGRVALNWTYNGPESAFDVQYVVERAPDVGGSPGTFAQVALLSRTTFIDGSVSPGTKYYYRVTPVTFGGPGTAVGPVSVTTVTGTFGTGAHVTFFDTPDLGTPPSKAPAFGPAFQAPDNTTVSEHPNINFFWGPNAPTGAGTGFGPDQFVVLWTMKIKPEFTESYTFATETDDGYKLIVNGQVLQDRLDARQGMTISNAPAMDLVAGQEYNVVMIMDEDGGDAGARLYWQSPHVPREVVPQVALTPVTPDLTPPTVADVAVDGHISTPAAYTSAFHVNVVFSEDVTGVDPTDFELVTPNGTIDASLFNVSYDQPSHTAIFTFPAFAGGQLDDGNYTLTIKASSGIADTTGNSLDADNNGTAGGAGSIPFYVFNGDTQKAFDGTAKKDRTIDFVDYQIMSRNFGMANPSGSDGDFTHDGVIDNADFQFLRTRFGQTLAGPAAPVATTPAPTPVPVVPAPKPTPKPAPKPAPKPVAAAVVAKPVIVAKPVAKPAAKFATRKIGAKDLLA
jgi:PA14 domain